MLKALFQAEVHGLKESLERAVPKEEGVGMDIVNHGEEAYSTGEGAVLLLDDEVPAVITNGKVKPEPSIA